MTGNTLVLYGQGIFVWQARCEILLTQNRWTRDFCVQARYEILLAQNSIIDMFAKANDLVLPMDKGLKYRGGVPE